MSRIFLNIPDIQRVRCKKLSGVAKIIADTRTRFLCLSSAGPQVFSNVVWKGGSYGYILKVVFDGPLHLSLAKIVHWYSRIPRTNLKLLQLWPLFFCQGFSFRKIYGPPKQKKSLEALSHEKVVLLWGPLMNWGSITRGSGWKWASLSV